MNIDRLGPVVDGVVYEDDIAISWELLPGMPAKDDLSHLNESNRQALQLLVNEGLTQNNDGISDPVVSEIQRLESKLDFLISLMGDLLRGRDGQLINRKISVGSRGIQVLLDSSQAEMDLMANFPEIPLSDYNPDLPKAENSLAKVSLFLDRNFPQPVKFLSRIEIVDSKAIGKVMLATFQDMDKTVKELLEKFIFQQHRRDIAHSRVENLDH